MFERSYAITIKDKQGKIYYLTEEMTSNIWSRKDGSKKKVVTNIIISLEKEQKMYVYTMLNFFQQNRLLKIFGTKNLKTMKMFGTRFTVAMIQTHLLFVKSSLLERLKNCYEILY